MFNDTRTRRDVLRAIGGAAVVASARPLRAQQQGARPPLCVFSKHLQWADYTEMADRAAELGFDGVDLTVRKGGHVEPERAAQDLPRAFEAVRRAGLSMPMITAGIVDAASPHTESILRAASALGIRNYRWGGFRYDYKRDITAQLNELKPRVRALAELNEKHNVGAMYHTHSGLAQVGASIWDIWGLVNNLDPRLVGVNYDIGHAVVEGGFGGWVNSAHLVRTHLRGVALKDFLWRKNTRGEWRPEWRPAGEGMVDFAGFFRILKDAGFTGPLQVHYEYEGLGGADHGDRKVTIPKEKLLAIMRKDVEVVRGAMKEAGI